MSEAVDTRIVEAKFDSAQFEKGVDRTVKKLDELKKSLTFEETGKSIADLTSKAKDATEKASSSLEKLENRITSFTGMLKQKLLSGIADEIVGVLFKIKNGFESLVSSLSTGQIGYGMQRYTDIMTSVRTMVANGTKEDVAYEMIDRLNLYSDQTSYSIDQLVNLMSQLKTGGAAIQDAEKMVEGLSNAAAAAGVNAQRAGTAYYNFAQAYQKGAMLQQDWQSFQNIGMSGVKMNQAILDAAESVGTLKKELDGTYRTVNKLDKQVKTSGADAKGITAQNMGQKLSSRWFNKAVMEKFTKDMYYFAEIDPDELKKYTDLERLIKEGKEDAEALDKLLEENGLTRFAYDAFRAGQEARSFTDVLNTLKDTISRGWSKSFEIIFGKLDEAKDFFTWLTENKLAQAIYNIAEFRNAVLTAWSESGGREDLLEGLKTIDEIIGNILGKFTIFTGEGDDFESKTTSIGHTLSKVSYEFRIFANNLKNWFDEKDGYGVKRIDRIKNAFATLGIVFSAIVKTLGLGFNFIQKLFVLLEPVFASFINALSTVAEKITAVINPKTKNGEKTAYDSLSNGLENLLKFAEPLASVLTTIIDVLGKVAAFFVEMATSTFLSNIDFIADTLGFILELFGVKSAQVEKGEGVIEGIKNDIIALGDACKDALAAIGDFFGALWNDLRKLLGMQDETEGTEEGGFFENIANFFNTNTFVQSVKDWVNKAIEDIGNFITSIPQKIEDLGNKIWDALTGIFWRKGYSEQMYNNIAKQSPRDAEKYKEAMKTPFAKWLEGAVQTVKDFIASLPSKVVSLIGTAGDFISTVINTIFNFFVGEKQKPALPKNKFDDRKEMEDGLETGFDHLKKTVVEFVKSIPERIANVLKSLASTAGKVTTKIWNFFDELIFGKKVQKIKSVSKNGTITWYEARVKTGFSLWLDNIVKSIKEFFEKGTGKIANIWNTIIDFFFGRKATEKDTKNINPKTNEAYKLTDRVKEGFSLWLDNTINTIWNWIQSIPSKITELWNTIVDFVLGKKTTTEVIFDPETGAAKRKTIRVKEGFSLWLDNTFKTIKKWIADVPSSLKNFWNNVVDFIFGKEETITVKDPVTGEENQITTRVKEGFSLWLHDTIQEVKKWLGGVNDKIRNLWNEVLSAIFGGSSNEGFDQELYEKLLGADRTGVAARKYKEAYDNKKNGIVQAADEFLKGIGVDIGSLIKNIPTYIAQGWDFSVDLFGDLLGHVDEWFKGKNAEAEAKKTVKEGTETIEEAVQKEAEKEDNSGFFAVIVTIGQKIKSLITETIPSILSGAWTFISSKSQDLFDAICKIFTGIDWKVVGETAQGVGDKIVEIIKGIPDAIRGAVDWIKKTLSGDDGINNSILQMVDPDKIGLKEQIKMGPHMLVSDNEIAVVKKKTKKTIWDSIKEIGKSIIDAMINLGPDILEGINKVLSWVGEKIDWLSTVMEKKDENQSLSEAVAEQMEADGNGNQSALVKALQKVGETIKKLIVEIIPRFIQNAVSELITKVPELIGNVFGGGEVEEATEAAMEQVQDQLGATADQMNSSKKFNILDALFGISTASAEESDKANDAFDDAADSTKDTKKKAGTVVDNILGVFGKFADIASSDSGRVITTLGMVALVLYVINRITDNLTVIDDIGYDAKWMAINTAVKFIAGLLTYMLVLAATGNKDQLKNVEDIFDKVARFIERLGHLFEVIQGLSIAKNITGALENKLDKSGLFSIKGIGAGIGSKLGSIAGYATVGTVALTTGMSVLTESLESWSQDLAGTFQMLGIGFGDLLVALEDLAKIGDQLDEAEKILTNLNSFFANLKDIFKKKEVSQTIDHDTHEVKEEVKVVDDFQDDLKDLMEEFVQLSGVIAEFKNAVSGENIYATEITNAMNELLGMTAKMSEFAKFSESEDFENFKYAIASLGSALSMYSGNGFENISDKNNISKAVGTVIDIIQDEKLKTFADSMKNDTLPDAKDVYKNSEKIVMLAGAIASIGEASKNINKNTGTYISLLYQTISSLTFGEDYSDTEGKITKFASNFGVIGNALGTFANEVKDFSAENLANAQTAINMTIELMNTLKGTGQGVLEKVFEGDKSLSNFGSQLFAYGQRLKEFLDLLAAPGTNYDQTGLDQALYAMRQITITFAQLSVVNKDLFKTDFLAVAKGLSGTDGLSQALSNFMKDLTGENAPHLTDEEFKQLNHILDLLNLLGTFSNLSNGSNFSGEMADLVSGLTDHNPFAAIAKVIGDITDVADSTTYDERINVFMDSFGNLMLGIAKLAQYTKGAYSSSTGWYIKDLMQNIGDIFSNLHANFEDIKLFVQEIGALDAVDVDRAATLFASLRDLGEALNYFKDPTLFTGIDNLKFFDWNGFMQKLKDALLVHFKDDEDFYAPKITPVLEISDDFINKANELRQMLGMDPVTVDETGGFNIPDISKNLADGIVLPEQKDYSEQMTTIIEHLATSNDEIKDFNANLRGLRFIINGKEFVEVIAPDIKEVMGYDLASQDRE